MHLGCRHILLDMPQSESIDNFAAILNRYLQDPTSHQKFVIRLTIPGDKVKAEQIYSKFIEFKAMTQNSVNVMVCLSIQADLPSESWLMRFYGEKVFAIQVSTNAFISNKKGYPILSETHAKIFKEYMKI